jgi:hypothetical protein
MRRLLICSLALAALATEAPAIGRGWYDAATLSTVAVNALSIRQTAAAAVKAAKVAKRIGAKAAKKIAKRT